MYSHRLCRAGCLYFAASVVLAASTPATAARPTPQPFAVPPQFGATDTFADERGPRRVTASASEFVVRMTDAVQRAAAGRPAVLPPRVTPPFLPESAVYLESRLEQRGLHVVRGMTDVQLAALPGISYAQPVLYTDDSEVPIYQSDRVIARFRENLTEADVTAVAHALGCDAVRLERGERRYLLVLRDPSGVNGLAVANGLHARPDLVEYAHPDFFLPKVAMSPPVINDPYYLSHQWHLDGDVAKGADPNSDINVEGAWDSIHGPTAQGSPTVRVSILDECVEKMHPDLFPNWAAGLDLDPDPWDDDPSPDAGQRHGTACAGVAVAKGNDIGVRGAAPDCGLIGVKFFGATIAEMAEGYYFSVDPNNDGDHSDGATIMSNSWGFANPTLLPPEVVNAIAFAANSGRNGKGCLVLFASANNDHTINGVSALAQLPTVMAVGGTNSHAEHTEFSDVGPELAIAAPTNDRGDDGVRQPWLDITTVDNTGSSGYNGLPDLDYTNQFGGTSSATPLAAGVLALIFSQDETMTAAQGRAIVQHTAVRIDEPFGRFDPITGHSHRYGFGRCDAAAAVAAANAGIRWPDRIKTLNLSQTQNDILLTWAPPPNDYDASLLVRSNRPFGWAPTDGQNYNVGEFVAPGVEVIYQGALSTHTDLGAVEGPFFYGVYPRSAANRWGFGAKRHVIRAGVTVFHDTSEGADPGWTHGGPGDEWRRGTPTSTLSAFSQAVAGSGPLAGLNGTRAINGNNCWGTDLGSTYSASADAWLQTPLINLTGIAAPVFLEYYDWCLLETFFDRCFIEVVDAGNNVIGIVDDDTGGDYDWTLRIHDLTPFVGQPIRVRFRLQSDGLLQRDGWFLDEVKVIVGANLALPPVADDVYTETQQNTQVNVFLRARDPNVPTTLSYVINSLPQHGMLIDPFAAPISTVPYTLVNNNFVVQYLPDTGYEGPDSFTYKATDGALDSNLATASLVVGTPVLAHDFPLSTDPGWLTEGLWAWGRPLGASGDPTSGFTGLNVYGYNLAGAYENNLPPTHLTMPPLNCTGLSRVTLNFRRWLGVESSNFDSATIEASRDGSNWETVWAHSGATLQENAWSLQSINIGPVADNQPFVQIRWTMGPTDGADVFAGWNIDDVQILAIGTPQANQPPQAFAQEVATAKGFDLAIALGASDANDDPLDYTILSLPTGGVLRDPDGLEIVSLPYTLAAGANDVTYSPDPDFAGPDGFSFSVHDGALGSNVAAVGITVIESAPFPFFEGFEDGAPLSIVWSTYSTGAGRIRVTNEGGPATGQFHVTMDSGHEGTFSSNELTLAVDLEGASSVRLRYDWRGYGEEVHTLPATWTGHALGDGVSISEDGETWHRIRHLSDAGLEPPLPGDDEEAAGNERADFYQSVVIELDAAAAAAGISYNRTFRIRFQQYDNFPIATDGIALDNIELEQGTHDPEISTSSLPPGTVGVPYGPVQLDVIGGDEPFVWTTPIEYTEQSLGASLYKTNGVAQNLHGDDVFFDYTLPFAFPFWGNDYTQIRIASDGWINFGAHVGSTWNNSTVLLAFNRRIAVLWDDLNTSTGDVYISESVPGQVTVRWDAVVDGTANPCRFSATLFDDGRIQLHYGSGNNPLTATVGVSSGDGATYVLSAYNAVPDLGDVDSMMFDFSRLPPGLVMDAAGEITGTPTKPGTWNPIFHLLDDFGREDTKTIPMFVSSGIYGDFDNDGDVDLVDWITSSVCFAGSAVPVPPPDCAESDFIAADADGDGDVDLNDFTSFSVSFSG